MAEGHQGLGPADPIEATGRQQVIGDEQRREAQLLGPSRETTDLLAVLPVLAGEQVGGDEDSEFHALQGPGRDPMALQQPEMNRLVKEVLRSGSDVTTPASSSRRAVAFQVVGLMQNIGLPGVRLG